MAFKAINVMLQKPKYRKGADIEPVQPSSDPDLKGCIRNGIVRNTASECFYNEQKETSDVGVRVRDQFDVVEAQGTLHAMRKKASEKHESDE